MGGVGSGPRKGVPRQRRTRQQIERDVAVADRTTRWASFVQPNNNNAPAAAAPAADPPPAAEVVSKGRFRSAGDARNEIGAILG